MQKLITPTEVSELLSISSLTLRKWRWEGKGPQFIKAGRKVLYRQEDIENWVNNCARSSTSDTGVVL